MAAVMQQATPNGKPTIAYDAKNKSFGDFANCVRKARCIRVPQEDRLKSERRLRDDYGVIEKAALAETSGAVGGYIVPYQYSMELMKSVAENSIFWPRAKVCPMRSKVLNVPLPDPTGSIGVSQNTNMFGGMQLQWKSAQSMAETEPKFRNLELVANELTGFLVISNQMFDDWNAEGGGDEESATVGAEGMMAFLGRFIAEAVAWWTDQAFFAGNGGGQPQGIVPPANTPGSSSRGTILVDRATANQVSTADLANMFSQLLPHSYGRAIWCASPGAIKQILAITSYAGLLYFMSGEERGKDAQGYLYGLPLKVTEKLPDLGSIGDVTLFDPGMYVVGFRDLLIDFSDQVPTYYQANQTVCRVVARVDGAPALPSVITLANQSATKVSPYVCLR